MTKNEVVTYVNAAIFFVGAFYVGSGRLRRHAAKKALEKNDAQLRVKRTFEGFYEGMNLLFPKTHPEDAPYSHEQADYNRKFKTIINAEQF